MKKAYPIFPAGMRVCFNGMMTEIKNSRERAFSLVSKLGRAAFVEFYDKDGVFDRIDYSTVLEIAKIQTPELVKKRKRDYSRIRFCAKCRKPKPANLFFGSKCGDCNNIVFF